MHIHFIYVYIYIYIHHKELHTLTVFYFTTHPRNRSIQVMRFGFFEDLPQRSADQRGRNSACNRGYGKGNVLAVLINLDKTLGFFWKCSTVQPYFFPQCMIHIIHIIHMKHIIWLVVWKMPSFSPKFCSKDSLETSIFKGGESPHW